MRFLDQQPFYNHQQSALQINFPQQQFDTQSRQQHLDEQQKLLQDNQLYQHQHQHQPVAQGYIDEGGNLCIIEYPETVDGAAGATNSAKSSAKQYSRNSTREKTRSSQKRRKKRKAKQQQTQQLSKKDFGRFHFHCLMLFLYRACKILIKINFIAFIPT